MKPSPNGTETLAPAEVEAKWGEAYEAHGRLIRPIAQALGRQRPDLIEDLCQVGAIGLWRAVQRYEPGKGQRFESYATACIAGEMRHYLRDHGHLVRPPRELVELRGKVLGAQAALLQADLKASPEAIAAALELPEEKVREVLLLEENVAPASLDVEPEAGEASGRYQLVDKRYASFQLAQEDALMLEAALARLRGASREVIEFAFYDDLTQTEIAKRLGISQMQVSRRLKAAMGELWKALNTKLF